MILLVLLVFFFQAEDGIRDLVRSRGLGDVYKRQPKVVMSPRFVADLTVKEGILKINVHASCSSVEEELSLIHI